MTSRGYAILASLLLVGITLAAYAAYSGRGGSSKPGDNCATLYDNLGPIESTATASSGTQAVPTPPVLDILVNGSLLGSPKVAVPPGSERALNVTAQYPWSGFPSLTGPLVMNYSFAPFPPTGRIPSWLHLCSSPQSVSMAKGTAASVLIHIALDNVTQASQGVSFAVHAKYHDPVSGEPITESTCVDVNGGNLNIVDRCRR